MKTNRPLHEIAQDIYKDWKKPNFAAAPYLDAMAQLDSMDEHYLWDDAKSIVLYFLSNASSWKGENARRIKKELKEMCK